MTERLTERARQFVAKNRAASIVSGQWLDKDRRRVTGPPETWVKILYRFSDGTQLTLNEADTDSLSAAGIEPVWWGDKQ